MAKFSKPLQTCFVQIPTELSPSPVTAVLLRDYSAQRVAGDKPIPVRNRH
ncbi:TPA: hypothetical protein MFN23_005342 [Klebsiella pneumoniae]|nr:hypothetical protein [Klebsiella pneumoniae]HBW8684114.1 hypothetical protein [Klebsiella pneumoniae]